MDSPVPATIQSTWIGEVVEAASTQFTAQCARDRLHEPPPFGSFVKIAPAGATLETAEDPFADLSLTEGALFGLVFQASTASIEPNRRAMAFGLAEEELHREQPQLAELL